MKPPEDTRPQVGSLFDKTKNRVQMTWVICISMTVILFTFFVTTTVAAVVTWLLSGETAYSLAFGGVGATSLMTIILWKPFEKAFQAAIVVQRLEILLVGLEEEWSKCSKLKGIENQRRCIRAARDAALIQMAQLGS
jgi:hypothetical protein